jgi:hypothetical protein
MGNRNEIAGAFLIGLGSPDMDMESFGCFLEVAYIERDEL